MLLSNNKEGNELYTEIVKIIEGGLIGDKEKVYNYATVLANNLEKSGDASLSKRIHTLLSNKKVKMASLDSFSTKPVDVESRMDIVEITYPRISSDQIVLSKSVEDEIKEFIECYKKRDEILKAGLEASNSLLLYGPPGCGKTTVAQYISRITELPLVTARLDGLISSLLGSTSKNIRKIFDYASKRECILFLDEFDVIAKLRDDKNELGELKRVVNSLIQNIDNLNNDSVLIAATNHEELLDSAIWRRFSKVIELNKPSRNEIGKLISILLKDTDNTISNSDKKIENLKSAFIGFSCSDIKTVINNCIRKSIIKAENQVNYCDILKEIYFHINHNIDNEDDFIKYLLKYEVTYREINENFGFSSRKIQKISKGE